METTNCWIIKGK